MESSLYGIAGVISQPMQYGEVFSFGGYFVYSPHDKRIIDGQLVDCFGRSTIKGSMDGELLEFQKRYLRRNYDINYKLTKNKDGLWVGEWDMEVAGNKEKGKVVSRIQLIGDNVESIIGPYASDGRELTVGFWEEFAQGMVREGSLKKADT